MSPGEPLVRAAGGVLQRRMRRGVFSRREVAVVHRPRYDDWSFPKGKRDGKESDEETALREVEEETGFRCRLGPDLGALEYRDARGRQKTVRYWLMELEPEANGQVFVPNREVDELRWCTAGEAGRLLTYEHDRDLLARAKRVRT